MRTFARRPVAPSVPIPNARGIAPLDAESRLSDAQGDLVDLGPPLASARDKPLPTRVLAAARDTER